jgi:hypothetical protein
MPFELNRYCNFMYAAALWSLYDLHDLHDLHVRQPEMVIIDPR